MQQPPGRTLRLLAMAGLLLLSAASVAWIATIWMAPPRDVARQARVEAQREARTPPLENRALARTDTTPRPAPIRETPTCERCHGELELLRQHTESIDDARALLVPAGDVRASAHGHLPCAECHSGYRDFPHTAAVATQTCADCHSDEHDAWEAGAHAAVDGRAVDCAACHSVHRVESVATLQEDAGIATMNGRCVACHRDAQLPAANPHAGAVPCSGCHEAHETRPHDDPASALAAAREPGTCGACHREALDHWQGDVHGDSALAAAARAHGERAAASGDGVAPTCTACHGGHAMLAPTDSGFAAASVQACAGCHEHAMDTWTDSYHGQAIELGSAVSATCSDCHGAHGVFPEEDARSLVAEARLVDTCGQCHQHARENFVAYDSHPDPFNPERNFWITASFFFMNGLLVFVLVVFGTHTLLWWRKIRREHGHGGTHGGHGTTGEDAR